MKIIGITGSLAMGKSFVATEFSKLGFPVFDADKEAGLLLNNQDVIEQITNIFPESIISGSIDKNLLRNIVFQNKVYLEKLESILHPIIKMKKEIFLNKHKFSKTKFAILDIPLLYEKDYDKECDFVIVVDCTIENQIQRVLERKKVTKDQYDFIISCQMSNEDRKKKADYVINTNLGKELVLDHILQIIKEN